MVVIDIGSNIGISSRFYLENNAKFVYLFEPDLVNLKYLNKNNENFNQRFVIEEKAVGISAGSSLFEFDKTGRYGRLLDSKNLDDGISRNRSKVEVIGIEEVLDLALQNFGNIDVLKIDIEGLELEIVNAIPAHQLSRIKKIQYETWPEGIVKIEPGY